MELYNCILLVPLYMRIYGRGIAMYDGLTVLASKRVHGLVALVTMGVSYQRGDGFAAYGLYAGQSSVGVIL